MVDVDWQSSPLGAKLDHYLNAENVQETIATISNEPSSDDGAKWRKAGQRLRRFQDLMNNDSCGARFRSTLGYQQLCAWRVLSEWMRSDHQPRHLSEAAVAAIMSGRYLPSRGQDIDTYPGFQQMQVLINLLIIIHYLSSTA